MLGPKKIFLKIFLQDVSLISYEFIFWEFKREVFIE